jgi:hypothetical protein
MYKIIGADLKEYGPVSSDQIRQWLAEGRVNGQTKIQAADTTEWRSLAEIPEFALLLPKAPLPPPVRPVPITPLTPPANTSAMAVWAMIVGIISVLCCQLLGPVAIVLGAVALSNIKNQPQLAGRGFAITGIVLGGLSLLIIMGIVLFAIFNADFLQNLQHSLPQ